MTALGELAVGNCPGDSVSLVRPLQDGPPLPLKHFLRRYPLLEPSGEPIGVPAEAHKQSGVPYPMEIVGAPIEDRLPLVAPSVAVVLVVERLVEVSHKVHDELQGLRLCGFACCRVPEN